METAANPSADRAVVERCASKQRSRVTNGKALFVEADQRGPWARRWRDVLGEITKRGDEYLRTLLIQGAKSAVFTAHRRSDRLSRWIVQLRDRVGWQKAAVALANTSVRLSSSMCHTGFQ